MTKAELIAQTMRKMNISPLPSDPPYCDGADEEEFIISVLQDLLPESDIKTCEDFKYLNVECCETCHKDYPHYEMRVIQLIDGTRAFVCHSVKEATHLQSQLADVSR